MKMQGGRISFRAQYRSLANSSVHRHITAGIQAVFDAPEDTAASFRQRIHVKLYSLSAVVTQQGRIRQVLLDPATGQAPPHTQLRKNASPTFHRHRPHIRTSQLSFFHSSCYKLRLRRTRRRLCSPRGSPGPPLLPRKARRNKRTPSPAYSAASIRHDRTEIELSDYRVNRLSSG